MGELRRRLVHLAGVGYPLLYIADRAVGPHLGYAGLQVLLVGSAAVSLVLEALRLSGHVDWVVFDELTREYEQEYLAGYALYMIGMATAVLAFQPVVALPALLMLTVGDPVSGLLSSGDLGKRPAVLAAMFAVCAAMAAPFVVYEGLPPLAALAGAATATVADGVKPVIPGGYVVDDNLTIPVGAAAAMAAVVALGA
ncbi:MAG: dolichol kinase [Halobacteriaceae archaeon]